MENVVEDLVCMLEAQPVEVAQREGTGEKLAEAEKRALIVSDTAPEADEVKFPLLEPVAKPVIDGVDAAEADCRGDGDTDTLGVALGLPDGDGDTEWLGLDEEAVLRVGD